MVHAPTLAAGPHTRLAAVWARRPEAGEALATQHGAVAARSLDELFGLCEAVVIAVAPEAQPDIAVQAARRGKHLLVEKPLATSVDDARRVVDAVGEAGVQSLVALTWRYAAGVRAFLEQARLFDAAGGRAWLLSGALLDGPFAASPWRQAKGALLDVGPHALDLIDVALGPVVDVAARASAGGWVGLTLGHEGGAVSQVSLSSSTGIDGAAAGVALYGREGELEVDLVKAAGPDTFPRMAAELHDAVRTGKPHPCGVLRGLHLQELIAKAEAQLS